MKAHIFAFAFVLLSRGFSLTSAKEAVDPKTKDTQTMTQTNMKSGMEKENKDHEMTPVKLMEVMNECNESFRIDMSYIQALNDSGSFPDETDKTPKCYVRCVLEKTGVASENGVYNPEMAGMVFTGERGGKVMNDVEVLAKSCVMRDEQCKCERAYQFMKCLMEKEVEEYEKTDNN